VILWALLSPFYTGQAIIFITIKITLSGQYQILRQSFRADAPHRGQLRRGTTANVQVSLNFLSSVTQLTLAIILG
jgi:hypothetical protein